MKERHAMQIPNNDQIKRKKRKPRKASSLPKPTNSLATDIEIPTQKLLDAQEEAYLGNLIQVSFSRIERYLLSTVSGYEQCLELLKEVRDRKRVIALWFPLRERMEKDAKKVEKELRLARAAMEKDSKSSPKDARKHLEKGIKVLKRYELNHEFLFTFATKIRETDESSDALYELPCSIKAKNIVLRSRDRLAKARDQLVLPNLRLVLKEVFRFQPTGMKRSDLFQEGILGLHRGIFRYDPKRKTRFSTYATYWIRQAIRKSLIDRSRLIRVPQAVQEDLRNEDSKKDPEERQRVQRIMRGGMSMFGEKDESPRDRFDWEVASSENDASVASENFHVETVPAEVRMALNSLKPREREILSRRFGIDGRKAQTLTQAFARKTSPNRT